MGHPAWQEEQMKGYAHVIKSLRLFRFIMFIFSASQIDFLYCSPVLKQKFLNN